MSHGVQMVTQEMLRLNNHLSEKWGGRDWEIPLHVLNIVDCHWENLWFLHALHCKEATVGDTEAISRKIKLVLACSLVVDDRSNVDYDVLCAEILKHRKFLRIFLVLISSKVDEWINDLNELILSVCHDESTDASDLEIKIVD